MKLTGRLLKDARERKNITLNEVSFTTKINIKILMAIEEGNAEALPPKTFLRGFVRSYAEYLKLDIPAVLSQFQEEMGSTKPYLGPDGFPLKAPSPGGSGEESDEIKPVIRSVPSTDVTRNTPAEDQMKPAGANMIKVALAVAAVLVVIVGIIVQQTIQKYENEKNMPTPSISADGPATYDTSPSTSTTIVGALTPSPQAPTPTSASVSAEGAHSEGPGVSGSTAGTGAGVASDTSKITPLVNTPATSTTTSTSTTVSTTTSTITTTTTQVALPLPLPNAVPVPTSSPSAQATPKPLATKSTPEGSTLGLSSPQEVILEAMDGVTLKVQIDGGRVQTMTMGREQIRTIKAKRKLQIETSDGGAVNIIHNGIDKGVPGKLGQPSTLNFP